jgi:hypothetical protein
VVYDPTEVAGKIKIAVTSQAFKNEHPRAENAGHLILLCYQGSSTNPVRR